MERGRIMGLLVAGALLCATAPACAPKRLAPVTAPVEAPPRHSTRIPQAPIDRAPGDLAAAAGLLPTVGGDVNAGEPAGPPAPADLSGSGAEVSESGQRVAELARTQVGKPYGWGGTGPERFDCSGLALYVYRQLGIALPRVSSAQASVGTHVDRTELKPGDLVFFSLRRAVDHVGIFLGDNRFVHAPRRNEPVRVDTLDDAWWNRAYRGARRVLGGEP